MILTLATVYAFVATRIVMRKKTTESLEDMMDKGKEVRTERNKEANNRNVNGKEIRTHTAQSEWIIEEECSELPKWSIYTRSLATTHISSIHTLSLLSGLVHQRGRYIRWSVDVLSLTRSSVVRCT